MKPIRWISGVVVLVCGVMAMGWMAFAADEIGSVTHVAVWAYGTPPQGTVADLFMADGVVSDEVVETVTDGAVHLRFIDGTEMRLGSSSTMTLDSVVYDPSQGTGEFVVELGTGVFRLITGSMNSEAFALSTPVATIGVRGSDIEIGVDANGTTTVEVNGGEAIVDPKVGDAETTTVAQDSSIEVAVDGTLSDGGAVEDDGLQSASRSRSNNRSNGRDSRSSSD